VWTTLHLQPDGGLSDSEPDTEASLSFDAMGAGLVFTTSALTQPVELTGPSSLRLSLSSSTSDADVFVVLGVVDPDGEEVVFQGALDPHSPVAQGWLRASHRLLDEERSLPWRPWHPHDRAEPLVPGEVYPLDIEIWPTSIVIPVGHRLTLTVRGRDYEYRGSDATGVDISTFKNRFTGCGPFVHDDPTDRDPGVMGGVTTIHLGPGHPGSVLLPVVPPA
jgi:predicted acyl esterase